MSTATATKPEIITFTEAFSRALHDAMETTSASVCFATRSAVR